MFCGLFSSFDPFNSSFPFEGSKWAVLFLVVLAFPLKWGVKICGGNSHLLFFLLSKISSSLNEIFSNINTSFILVVGIFYVILSMNLVGLLPFSFSPSAHLSVNFSLALPLWGGGVLYSVVFFPNNFIAHLLPQGSPSFLWPLLVLVELVSLMIRPITLSVRLMANVIAGHLIITLLGEYLSFQYSGLVPPLIGGFLLFEVAVATIQSYVFTNLLSLYFNESEDLNNLGSILNNNNLFTIISSLFVLSLCEQ